MFEIGNSLRAARERQGLTYPEIEHATKIRSRYIRALEEEEFTVLPSDTYIRGFLRTYADYLGLDGDVYVEEYASRFITSWLDDVPPSSARRRRSRERTIERRGVLLALAGIGVVTALVIAAWRYGGTPPKPPAAGRLPGRHVARTHELTLRAVGDGTYLVVRRRSKAGPLLFEGTLARGTLQRFTGTRFYVFARRPRGVRIVSQAGVSVVGSA